MNNFDNLVYQILSEADYSRRDFLKGLGAAALASPALGAQGLNLSGLPWETAARKSIMYHEGTEQKVYQDTSKKKIPTIGVGFNLNRNDARSIIKSIGANYDALVLGKESLSKEQINSLFQINFKEAVNIAKKVMPNFDKQPDFMKVVLTDMAFNLGETRLRGFKKFLAAVSKGQYDIAAKEMIDSPWYSQVGRRSKNLVNIVKQRSL